MTAGIIVLNFGEPGDPSLESVTDYLESIFRANAILDDDRTASEVQQRSRELARRRAPALLEEYRVIGGSPLSRQSLAQATALEAELLRRGQRARTYIGMQFTDPSISEAARRAVKDGVDLLVGLPVYPLCGHSTTVAALEMLAEVVRREGWDVPLREISGWHPHPVYLEIRAHAVRSYAVRAGMDLTDPGTHVVFSAHGTPIQYLKRGSCYDRYVHEWCGALAREIGVKNYSIGFQNHSNRGVEWTQPEITDVVRGLKADRVVVDAVSFMHEQSETLSELDVELREVAEAAGIEFHRIPIPHDDPRFAAVLADLVEPLMGGKEPDGFTLLPCRCRSDAGTLCLNANAGTEVDRPPSRSTGF